MMKLENKVAFWAGILFFLINISWIIGWSIGLILGAIYKNNYIWITSLVMLGIYIHAQVFSRN